jgi:hypothetical protein
VPKAVPGRRVARALDELASITDPLKRLEAVRGAREAAEALEARAVREARAAGATWGQIGSLYGVSKQAAQQRFRKSV